MTERKKYAVHFGVFLAAFFTVWTLRATIFYSVDEQLNSPTLKAAYSNLMKLLIWVLPAMVFVHGVKGVEPAKYWAWSSFGKRDHRRNCLQLTLAFFFGVAVLNLAVGGKSISLSGIASTPILILILSFGVSPLLEEILFRGFVLKELLGFLPLAGANVLASVLFVAAHLPYWISHGGLTSARLETCVGIFLFSLLAGWLFEKSGSIWPPTLAHTANNLLASLLVA